MANHVTLWRVLHLFCILAHIGMSVTGVVIFVINANDRLFGDRDPHELRVIYPWTTVAIGGFGTVFNIAVFVFLLLATTAGRLMHRGKTNFTGQKVPLVASLAIQSIMTCADTTLGGIAAASIIDKTNMAALCAVAFFASAMSIATLIFDIVQLRYYRRLSKGNQNDLVEMS